MARNEVIIEFKGKNTQLVTAIEKLDKVTKGLLGTQAKIIDSNARTSKSNKKSLNAVERLEVQLKVHGKTLNNLRVSQKLITKAREGDAVALAKLRMHTQAYIRELKRTGKGMFELEHSNRILGGSFAVLRSKLLLASFGASLFGMSIGKLTRLFGEQERAEKKLETAIGTHSKALLAFASAQQKVTTFGDEEIINAMALAGAYTNNEKALARIAEASMNLAKAKGMDLNSAVDLVSKSIFSSTNALSRYGIQIEGTVGSTERLENATKNISELYGGQAQADTKTFLGAMKDLQDAVGDLGENIGQVLSPAVLFFTKRVQSLSESFNPQRVKIYGSALLAVGAVYGIAELKAKAFNLQLLRFNKLSKKNIASLVLLAGAMVADYLDLFEEKVGESANALELLEGKIGDLNSKGMAGAVVFNEFTLAQLKLALVSEKATSTEISLAIAKAKHKQVQEQLNIGIAENDQLTQGLGLTIKENQKLNEEALKQEFELRTEIMQLEREQRKEQIALAIDTANTLISTFGNVTSSLKSELSAREEAELTSLRQTEEYKRASDGARIEMEAKLTKSFADEKVRLFNMEKASSMAQIIVNTASAVMKVYQQLGAFATPVAGLVVSAGALQLATVAKTKPPKFEEGGLVGGSRHSAGGTMIEAEQGEFVMSRRAVQTIGIEALNQINAGAGTGVTVNISAPLVDETVIDHIIPSIERARRMNLA
mgnify:CR=1 FL=1